MKRLLLLLPIFCFTFLANSLYSQISDTQINAFLMEQKTELGLSKSDLSDWVIKDQHTSAQSGITHLYLRQRIEGIEIHGAELNVHQFPNGEIWTSGSRFVSNAAKLVETSTVQLTEIQAVETAAKSMGYSISQKAIQLESLNKENPSIALIQLDEFSLEPIPTQLIYQIGKNGKLRIAWDLAINETKDGTWWGLRIDAQTGEILEKDSWTISCQWEGHQHDQGHCNSIKSKVTRKQFLLRQTSWCLRKSIMFLRNHWKVPIMVVERLKMIQQMPSLLHLVGMT